MRLTLPSYLTKWYTETGQTPNVQFRPFIDNHEREREREWERERVREREWERERGRERERERENIK